MDANRRVVIILCSLGLAGGGVAIVSRQDQLASVDQAAQNSPASVPRATTASTGESQSPTFGSLPYDFTEETPVEELSDYLAVSNSDNTEIAGYVRRADMLRHDVAQSVEDVETFEPAILEVFNVSLELVGYWVPGTGFVTDISMADQDRVLHADEVASTVPTSSQG